MILVCAFIFSAWSANAATLTVDASLAETWSNYNTIQWAVNAATSGDEIIVANWTYFERLVIDKSITLKGTNKASTIIDAGWPWTANGIQVLDDDVTLMTFTLQNATNYGIKVNKCDDCGYLTNFELRNVIVQNSFRSNIDLNGVEDSILVNIDARWTLDPSDPKWVWLGMQNTRNTFVRAIRTSDNPRGGIGIFTTTRDDYPTAAGSEWIVIEEHTFDEWIWLYTQETDWELSSPTADQYICQVTSEDNSAPLSVLLSWPNPIEDYVYYFEDRAIAEDTASWTNWTATCDIICGDSFTEWDEQCDDGNLNDGDGCSSTCSVESVPTISWAPICGDGNVYAKVTIDVDEDLKIWQFNAVNGQWFIIEENWSPVIYANENAENESGAILTTTDWAITVRQYGNEAWAIDSFKITLDIYNAVNITATPEDWSFAFEETWEFIDQLWTLDVPNGKTIGSTMIVSTWDDGFVVTYTSWTQETLECPADPFVSPVAECRDGSIYASISTSSDVPMYINGFVLVPDQIFELFDGENYVEYDVESEEGVVISQDTEWNLRIEQYQNDEQTRVDFDGVLNFIHGEAQTAVSAWGSFPLNDNDEVTIEDSGSVTLDLQVASQNDGVVITYKDTNGTTVCEGDVVPVTCDEVGYWTLSYEGFERSFLLADWIDTPEVSVSTLSDWEVDVEVKEELGDFEFELVFTNAFATEFTAEFSQDWLEDEAQWSDHTDEITIEENTVTYSGRSATFADQFTLIVQEDPRCIATVPFEAVAMPVCGDGNVYARLVSETIGTYSLWDFEANFGDWFLVSEGETPVVYTSDVNYGLVVTHTTPWVLQVALLNDEVTDIRIDADVTLEFSNGVIESFEEDEVDGIEDNETVTLEDGTVVFDIFVTTADDRVNVMFDIDQESCLEDLECNGTEYGILEYDDVYALFDLSVGYIDDRFTISQSTSGDVAVSFAAQTERTEWTLTLINREATWIDALFRGDGLETDESIADGGDEVTADNTVVTFSLESFSRRDDFTVTTTLEDVCEEDGEEIDVCPDGDFSGSTTDGTCEEDTNEPTLTRSWGGGRSSSIGSNNGTSNSSTPSTLLETWSNPEEEEDDQDEQEEQEENEEMNEVDEIVDQVEEITDGNQWRSPIRFSTPLDQNMNANSWSTPFVLPTALPETWAMCPMFNRDYLYRS